MQEKGPPGIATLIANLQKSIERTERNTYQQIANFIDLRARLNRPECRIPPLRGWAISPDLALLLMDLLEERRPKAILELGSGFSSVIFARYAAKSGAKFLSVDHSDEFAATTRALLEHWDLASHAEVIVAPIEKNGSFYDLSGVSPDVQRYDFVFIDGPPSGKGRDHEARGGLLPKYAPLLKRRATIVLDDYKREGEQSIVSRWANEGLARMVKEDTTLEKHAAILMNLG